jgi:hypothetical protein
MFASAQVNLGNNSVGMASHGNDSGLYVEFEIKKELLSHETDQRGVPTYKEVPYVTIYTPGDSTKRLVRPVKLQDDQSGPSDITRFPNQWNRFQAGEKQKSDGNCLTKLGLGETEIKKLSFMNILSIEHLATLPDFALDDVGLGARGIRESARNWLETHKDGKEEVDVLKAQVAELTAKLEAFMAASQNTDEDAPRRGRPPKQSIEENNNV